MADDKSGRDKQARDSERRQREREIRTELERGDETEPPIETGELAEIEAAVESLSFPTTGAEVVEAVGDREIETDVRTYTVEDLVPDADDERFGSPAAVRTRIQRPVIAAAMKRIVEASGALPNTKIGDSQRTAYEKTLRELKAIDADDADEGVRVVADWIVDRIRDDEKLPGSRAVRRQAAAFCRANGYEIRNDDWLGI
ncbi:hypothetical protein [Halorubrum sp. DTA98]|uniref:DUF5789 family protein n=1 Tax=Halorubrum sp. DTA98 TaxID=3402163 RepID=UPI003AAE222E